MFRKLRLSNGLKYLEVASLCTATAATHAQSLDHQSPSLVKGERFVDFLGRASSLHDPADKRRIIDELVKRVKQSHHPIIEDSTVYLMYRGKASRIGIAGDFNGWNPASDTMSPIDGTDFFYFMKSFDVSARFEYKLVVDSAWILDPCNTQQSIGGYGPNSEIWMPAYTPPMAITYREGTPRGKLDTMSVKSTYLNRTHPVFVYTPAGYAKSRRACPSIFVTDGGEYISLALMLNVLDNLIADKRIEPVVAIFADPRTDITNSQTSARMYDYTMNASFVNFAVDEVLGRVKKKYRIRRDPRQTAIMGSSLGGLIATFASYSRPDIFGLCAAQSPSYWWKDEAMIDMMATGRHVPIKLYIETGTIRDAQVHARKMKKVLEEKGYEFSYAEYPEGHNWGHWRAHIEDILVYFFGTQR